LRTLSEHLRTAATISAQPQPFPQKAHVRKQGATKAHLRKQGATKAHFAPTIAMPFDASFPLIASSGHQLPLMA